MPAHSKSLKTLLGLGLVSLCILPILAVSFYASSRIGTQVRAAAEQSMLDLSAQIATKLDMGMHERWRDITLVATLVGGQGTLSDQSELRDQFEALQRDVPIYAWIGAADTNGRVVVSSQRLLQGNDVSSRPWFRAGIQAPFVGDVHEAVLLAQKLPALENGEPPRFVDIAMPLVRKDGLPIGVLGAHLSWTWANEVAYSVLDRSGGQKQGAEALVVSRDGVVLMGPKDLRGQKLELASLRSGLQGVAQSRLERWPDGRSYVTAVAPTHGEGDYRGLDWVVLVRHDADTDFASVSDLQRHIILSGLAVAALACAVGWHQIGRITQPLQTIARAAKSLSDGDLSVPVPPTRAFAEAVTLSASLVHLAAALADQPRPNTPEDPPQAPVSAPRVPAGP